MIDHDIGQRDLVSLSHQRNGHNRSDCSTFPTVEGSKVRIVTKVWTKMVFHDSLSLSKQYFILRRPWIICKSSFHRRYICGNLLFLQDCDSLIAYVYHEGFHTARIISMPFVGVFLILPVLSLSFLVSLTHTGL